MSDKALWAKCPGCGYCWPAAYYPIDLAKLGGLLKECTCPKGCAGAPVVAKQSDGMLLEETP